MAFKNTTEYVKYVLQRLHVATDMPAQDNNDPCTQYWIYLNNCAGTR